MEPKDLKKLMSNFDKIMRKELSKTKAADLSPYQGPGEKEYEEAKKTILKDIASLGMNTASKAFVVTTQNLGYMHDTVEGEYQSAFVVMGGGDPVFELLSRNIRNITACDNNPNQSLIYHLRVAAFRALNKNDYENFILKSTGRSFLSSDLFKKVQEGFIDEDYKAAWIQLMTDFSKEDISEHLLKRLEMLGGSYERAKMGLNHVTKEGYSTLRNNIDDADVSLIEDDAIEYLDSSDRTYDYIDLTNVVSGIVLGGDKKIFYERLGKIKGIMDEKLNPGGTMVFDYQFGVDPSIYASIKPSSTGVSSDLCQQIIEVYRDTYEYFLAQTGAEVKLMPKVTTGFGGKKDCVILARKRIK